MKQDTAFKIFVIASLLIQFNHSFQLGGFLPFDDASPGKGFYSDAGTFTNRQCFNVLNVSKTLQQEDFNLEPKNVHSMLTEIDPDGIMFKGLNLYKDDYNYLFESSAKTFSLFFYSKISQTVNIEYDEKNLLTKEGLMIKEKSPANFKFVCGDSIINQYEEGGIIFFSINFTFKRVEDITRIMKAVNLNQKISQLIPSIVQTANSLRIEGKIMLTANQYGGNVYDLAQINDSACDLKDGWDCLSIVDRINKYVTNNFSEGFKKDEKGIYTQNLVPLFHFNIYKTLKEMGIDTGISALTKEILEARKVLEVEYKKYKLAYLNLVRIVNDYPVPLGIAYSNLIQKSKENLSVFTSNAQNKVTFCFNGLFDKCEKSKKNILEKLDKNLVKDIEEMIEPLRIISSYEVELSNDMCLRSKTHKTPTLFKIQVYKISPSAIAVSGDFTSRIIKFNGFDSFTVSVSRPDLELLQYFDFDTIITDNGKKMEGILTCYGDEDSQPQTLLVSGELIEINSKFSLAFE